MEINIDSSIIDVVNRVCYDGIADEYDDPEHQTCRDFDEGTELLWKELKSHYDFGPGLSYLDIGVGTGISISYGLNWLRDKRAQIEVLDISKSMLEKTKNKFGDIITQYHHESIFTFNPTKKYDIVMASLCDPYLTPRAITVFRNLLTESGLLLITQPSNLWAKKTRSSPINMTTFNDRNKKKHVSFSFCWDESELIYHLNQNDLQILFSRTILINDVLRRKKNISSLNEKLFNINGSSPLLTICVIRKR